MQHRPDQASILRAVARFLERELKPAIKDPALSFRVLVAASLASIMASEVELEDSAEGAELERLRQLLPDATLDEPIAPQGKEARRKAIEKMNQELAERLRAGVIYGDDLDRVMKHVKLTLQGELLMVSPRFDTSNEIE